jgi:hypothetical protein
VITWINRICCRLTGNAYGDQGMFVRAAVFRRLGGFKDWALMEDLDFSQRLRRAGRRVLVHAPLRTSGRRFSERGVLRTCGFCTWMIVRHTLGLDTQRYAERWRGPATQVPGSVGATRCGRGSVSRRSGEEIDEVPPGS